MPLGQARLTPEQIGILRAWIDQGAKWPDGAEAAAPKTPAKLSHWSFQPIRKPAAPVVLNAGWIRNPVDAFILARLEA